MTGPQRMRSQTELAPGVPSAPERPRSLLWWVAGAIATALVVLPYAWLPLHRAATPAAKAPGPAAAVSKALGFVAVRQNADWNLTWDRAAVAKLEPVGAILTIRDGGIERQSFLSPRDLANGLVVYTPHSGDLEFTLKISAPGGSDPEEEIRVIGTEVADTRPPEPSRPPAPLVLFGSPPASAPARPVVEEAARRVLPPAPAAAPVKPPERVELAAAPETSAATASAAGKLPSLLQGSIAPAPAPPVTVASTPAVAETVPAPPPSPAPDRVRREPPVPLREIAASWPEHVPRESRVEVQIRAEIDARGRVVRAAAVGKNAGNYPFVNSALTATRVWTFRPAQEDGHPVAGDIVLKFRFEP